MGDSWGCGVWGNRSKDPLKRDYGIIHKGLEAFLSEKHLVTNICIPGGTNIKAVRRLTNTLHQNFDYVFWFITDPLRDINCEVWFERKNLHFDALFNENINLLKQAYETAQKLNIRIHCIGGAGHVYPDVIKDYSNLISYIPSLTEYLLPEYKQPLIWNSWQWMNNIKKDTFDEKSLDRILEYRKQQEILYSCKELFWPDGCHPNLKGHEILFNKISKDFNL